MRPAATLLGVLLRDASRHPGQAATSVLGVALGLALVVAVHAASSAARDAFVRTFTAVAGPATHQVVGVSGLAPDALDRVRAHPHVDAAQPVIEGTVPVEGWVRGATAHAAEAEPPLRLLGLDPFLLGPFLRWQPESSGGAEASGTLAALVTRPATVLAPEAWAAERGLEVGDSILVVGAGHQLELAIVGLLPGPFSEATHDVAVVDLATADEVLGRRGRLDRVDVIASHDADLSPVLLPGERAERPATRGERAGRLVDAFRLNLVALSSLALLVGGYLVFNAAQFTVVRRRTLLGQLRCLGASRPALLLAVLGELALLGLAGAALGLIAGLQLARGLVDDVARTVSTLYGFVRVDSVELDASRAAALVALAVAVVLVAGWFPAWDAALTPPRLVGLRSAVDRRHERLVPRLLATIAIAGAATVLVLAWPTRAAWPGMVAALGMLAAAGAAVPLLLRAFLPALREALGRTGRATATIAVSEVERSLEHAGAATSALSIALAMAIGVMVMVTSFEREVTAWLDAAVRADLYVGARGSRVAPGEATLPFEVAELAARLEAARAVELLRGRDAVLDGRLIRVVGVEGDAAGRVHSRAFLEGDPATALSALGEGAVLVSEPLSNHHDLHVGDELAVATLRGPRAFPIAGVFRDYALDRGYALLDGRTYLEAFGETGLLGVAVTLRDGTDPSKVAERLRRLLAASDPPVAAEVTAGAALKRDALDAFAQTFAVTRVIEGMATGLALVGVALTLVCLLLERLREVATLRALGASLGTVGGLFAVQGALLAGTAAAVAVPVGALLAWLLVDVVNLRSFGWTFVVTWPWGQVLLACALALAAGLSAAVAPWWTAARRGIVAGLRR